MTLPANLSTGTVTGGPFLDGSGNPQVGVPFLLTPAATRITDGVNVVDLTPVNVATGAAGTFSVVLPATNDVDYSPINWTWRINGSAPTGERYDFSFALAGGTVINIATVPQIVGADGSAFPQSNLQVKGPVGTLLYVAPTAGSDSYDGLSAGTAFGTIAAALAASIPGSEIKLLPGTHVVTNHTSKNNLTFRGCGVTETKLRFASTTGEVFDLTNCSDNVWRDLSVLPNGLAFQKTAGSVFKLAGTGIRNRFENLWIQGGFRAFDIGASNVTLRDITCQDFNAGWAWDYVIGITAIGATSVTLDKVVGIGVGQAGAPNGFVYITGAASTINLRDVIYSTPSSGLNGIVGLNINGGAQWVYAAQCEFESGSAADGCTISGAATNGIHLRDCHFIGTRGVVVSGTPYGVTIEGGEIVKPQQHGIHIQGGTHVSVKDVIVMDASQQTTNTYDGVRVDAGVTDFDVVGTKAFSTVHGNGNVPKYGVNVVAGASDRYVITQNRSRNVGTGTVNDGGAGIVKVVANNI